VASGNSVDITVSSLARTESGGRQASLSTREIMAGRPETVEIANIRKRAPRVLRCGEVAPALQRAFHPMKLRGLAVTISKVYIAPLRLLGSYNQGSSVHV